MKYLTSACFTVVFVGFIGLGVGRANAETTPPAPAGWTAPAIDIHNYANPSTVIMAVLDANEGECAPLGALTTVGVVKVNGVEVPAGSPCTAGDLVSYGVLANTTERSLLIVLSSGEVLSIASLHNLLLGLTQWLVRAGTHWWVCECDCGNEVVSWDCPNSTPECPCSPTPGAKCRKSDGTTATLHNCGSILARIRSEPTVE
ncbi:MAG: hypothetical protein EXS15_05755 [Phycisphaerales bacterium]|nr:hypothetical protein [Phycisphaerales bacterium]